MDKEFRFFGELEGKVVVAKIAIPTKVLHKMAEGDCSKINKEKML